VTASKGSKNMAELMPLTSCAAKMCVILDPVCIPMLQQQIWGCITSGRMLRKV